MKFNVGDVVKYQDYMCLEDKYAIINSKEKYSLDCLIFNIDSNKIISYPKNLLEKINKIDFLMNEENLLIECETKDELLTLAGYLKNNIASTQYTNAYDNLVNSTDISFLKNVKNTYYISIVHNHFNVYLQDDGKRIIKFKDLFPELDAINYCYAPEEIFSKITIDKNKIDISVKEKNTMKILELYKNRNLDSINEKYDNLRDEVIKEDKIQKLLLDTENEINVLLNREENNRIKLDLDEEIYTNETEQKLQELENKLYKEKTDLNKKVKTLESLFELTEDYKERVNILQKYEVLDKKLNLIVE